VKNAAKREEPILSLYRHDFLVCPWCNEESGCRIDHLYGDKNWKEVGPWYCGECRKPIRATINAPGDVVVTRDEKDRRGWSRSMALLKLDGRDGPVFFVMDHDRYWNGEREGDEENQQHQRYFFEEHSCPTNWLNECVAVIKKGDCDPHGFLDFVRAVDVPADFDANDDGSWFALFPEAFETGPMIDGALTPSMLRKP
jgi:hypothetical protein